MLLDGTKLKIRERTGRAPQTSLTCRDTSIALPAPGSPGDPSLFGASIEITIDAGGAATLAVPAGASPHRRGPTPTSTRRHHPEGRASRNSCCGTARS